jgi:hypothetical protein
MAVGVGDAEMSAPAGRARVAAHKTKAAKGRIMAESVTGGAIFVKTQAKMGIVGI